MSLEKAPKKDNNSLQQIFNSIPLLKYLCFGSFPSNFVPTLGNITFANINTQPTSLQSEFWIFIANSRHKLCFVDSLGRPSFLKQQYEQMMPQQLQSHPRVCGFYAIYAAFPLFKFRQKEITGAHDAENKLHVCSISFFST